ncbi:MAG: hypothetical protein ACKO5K_07035 [Armatimonadota bacterium]
MKYHRCGACDFNVTASDRHCPNCGAAHRRAEGDSGESTLPFALELNDSTRAAMGGFLGAVLGGMLMNGMGVAVGVAVGVSLGVLLGADREWKGEVALPAGAESLRLIEERIRQRLLDIGERESRLAETLRSIDSQVVGAESAGEADGPWHRVRERVAAASALLARQRDRYHAKLWEIVLVRWQNRLDPLASDWDSLDHAECGRRLERLNEIQDEGRRYLEQWEGVDLSELPEARRCLDRLRTALGTCDQLRERLIVHQATLALQGIAPAEEVLDGAVSAAGASAFDTFQARADLGEFTSAFDDLEEEYQRLRSEQELAERASMVRRLGRGA